MQYFRIGPTPWLITSQPFRSRSATAVAQLDKFPGELRLKNELHGMPEMEMI